MNDLDPIVENWYRNLETQEIFEVVAVDEHAQTVEIQYFEGEIEELDLDTWYDLVLDPVDPPEDWSGPYDDLERGDLGDGDLPAGHSNWENPFTNLD